MKMFVVFVFALCMGIVLVQNTDVVTFRFLMWDFAVSRILMLGLSLIVGFLMGFVAGRVGRRTAKA